jgi:hypothetical protein
MDAVRLFNAKTGPAKAQDASPAKIVRRTIFILFKVGIRVDIGIVSNVFQFKTAALEIY